MRPRKLFFKACKTGLVVAGLALLILAVTNLHEIKELKEASARSMSSSSVLKFKPSNDFEEIEVNQEVSSLLEKEQKSEYVTTLNNNFTSELHRVPGFSNGLFLFSAFLSKSTSTHPYDTIVLQGLESSKYKNTPLSCCIKYESGNVATENVTAKSHWSSKPNSGMAATQYTCQRSKYQRKNSPVAVTLSRKSKKTSCHQAYDLYTTLHHTRVHKMDIAVCTKIVSRDVSPSDILTWLELHRRQGVTKFVVYTYNLNVSVTEVLKYYEAEKLVEIHPFRLPKIKQGNKLVQYGTESFEAMNIEQTLMYDCFERMKGYKYLLVLDTDEYLIPNKVKTLSALFKKLWKSNTSAAGFSFLVHLHITSWKPTNTSSAFLAGRYTKRTNAMEKQMKHVTQPSRLEVGGLSTYSFTPTKYFTRFLAPEDEATIHHFRSCKNSTDWQTVLQKECRNTENEIDTSVADMLSPIEKEIIEVKNRIFKKQHE